MFDRSIPSFVCLFSFCFCFQFWMRNIDEMPCVWMVFRFAYIEACQMTIYMCMRISMKPMKFLLFYFHTQWVARSVSLHYLTKRMPKRNYTTIISDRLGANAYAQYAIYCWDRVNDNVLCFGFCLLYVCHCICASNKFTNPFYWQCFIELIYCRWSSSWTTFVFVVVSQAISFVQLSDDKN